MGQVQALMTTLFQVKHFYSKIDAEQWYQVNLPSDATGQTTLLPLPQVVYMAPAPDGLDLIAYSDGTCLSNGKKGVMAGVGVYGGDRVTPGSISSLLIARL